MHLQPVFRIDGRTPKDNNQNKKTHPARVVGGSVSEDIFHRGLCLPSGTALTRDELNRIIDIILDCGKVRIPPPVQIAELSNRSASLLVAGNPGFLTNATTA